MLKKVVTLISCLLIMGSIYSQERLKSGLIQVTGFPTNNGDGTFTITGTFNDPTGLTFPAEISPGMLVNKGNDFFTVQSASNNGVTLTLIVEDTYGAGFISGGTFTVGQLTPNLSLPGLAPSGDSDPSLSTPPDQSSKFNLILSRIDRAFEDLEFKPQKGDTIFQVSHGFALGSVLTQASGNGAYLSANTSSAESLPVGMVVEILHPDTFVIDHSGWIYNLPGSLSQGQDYFLQDNGTLGTTPDEDFAVFILRTSSVNPGKAYFDLPESILDPTGNASAPSIIASNGLNDQDAGPNLDIEFGGALERNTTLSSSGQTLTYDFISGNNFVQSTWTPATPSFQTRLNVSGQFESYFQLLPSFATLVGDNIATGQSTNISASATNGAVLQTRTGGVVDYSLTVGYEAILISGLNSYIDDAAADADASLPSGGLYLLIGDRTLRIKP